MKTAVDNASDNKLQNGNDPASDGTAQKQTVVF